MNLTTSGVRLRDFMLKNTSFRSATNVIHNTADAVHVIGEAVISPALARLRWRQVAEWMAFNLLLSVWTAALILRREEHGFANIFLVAAVALLVRNVFRHVKTVRPLP